MNDEIGKTRKIGHPKVDDSGRMLVPGYELPLPTFSSDASRAYLNGAYTYYETQFGGSSKSKSSAEKYFELHSRVQKAADIQNQLALSQYKVEIDRVDLGGMTIEIVKPVAVDIEKDWGIIHLCGGVAFLGNKVVQVAVCLANLMKVCVYVPRYRAVPKVSVETQSQDIIKGYEYISGKHSPNDIGIFGESSGTQAIITLIQSLMSANAPVPSAVGLIGHGNAGDSQFMCRFIDPTSLQFQLLGINSKAPRQPTSSNSKGQGTLQRPLLNEDKYRWAGFPPTQLITGGRDCSLSSTIELHRQLLAANVDADLNIYEGMTHAHHTNSYLPESSEVLVELSAFFRGHLGNNRTT